MVLNASCVPRQLCSGPFEETSHTFVTSYDYSELLNR